MQVSVIKGTSSLHLNNFDSITHFGYRFIQGNINAPNTSYAQWYGWTIGLGINYAYSSYAAQFALPRNAGNPVLSVTKV